jgi:hypothetical protein
LKEKKKTKSTYQSRRNINAKLEVGDEAREKGKEESWWRAKYAKFKWGTAETYY